jgi:hypothetical protein
MFALTAVSATPPVAGVLTAAAGADPSTVSLVTFFSSFGVLGVVCWMFFTSRLYSKSVYDEMRRDRDQARGEVTTMTTKMLADVVPALRDSTVAVEKARRRGDD